MSDICLICGGKLGAEIWMINPPIRGMKCLKCGRVEEVFRDEAKSHPRTNHRGKVYPFKEVQI